MTAGYSGTALVKKLGIGPETDVLMLGDALLFDVSSLGPPPETRAAPASFDVVLLFCPQMATLERLFDEAKAAHRTAGAIWVCWPKKASGYRTDLTENLVRDHGLAAGRVDVKIAAVDAIWSGLKFVTRLRDR